VFFGIKRPLELYFYSFIPIYNVMSLNFNKSIFAAEDLPVQDQTDSLREELERVKLLVRELEKENTMLDMQNRELQGQSMQDQAVLAAAQKEISNLKLVTLELEDEKVDEDIPAAIRRIKGPRMFQSPGYIQELRSFFKSLKRPVNIAVFGNDRHGKSSLVTTWATALSSKRRIKKGLVSINARGVESSGRILRKVKAGKLNFVDCCGFPEGRINDKEVERVLDGPVKDGDSLYELVSNRARHPANVPEDEAIHAVVVVVDAVEIQKDENTMKRVNEMIRLLNERGMIPMIALNKVDLLDDRMFSDRLNGVFKSIKVLKGIHYVHQETGLSSNQIFPVKCYDIEYEREEVLEKLALLCLREVIQTNMNDDDFEDDEDSCEEA
jgi:G3E family GTPase